MFNLTVEDAHLFYANGILSSNTDGEDHAADALRYGAMAVHDRLRRYAEAFGKQGHLSAHSTLPALSRRHPVRDLAQLDALKDAGDTGGAGEFSLEALLGPRHRWGR